MKPSIIGLHFMSNSVYDNTLQHTHKKYQQQFREVQVLFSNPNVTLNLRVPMHEI